MGIKVQTFDNIEEFKADMAKRGSSDAPFIKYIPSDGIKVRFLEEPDKWIGYVEYYLPDKKRMVPMEEGEVLPDSVNRSKRYLASALLIDDNDNETEVVPLKLPKTLANDLNDTLDLTGSITDRDFTLIKKGEGMDTRYKSFPDSTMPRDLDKYEPVDLVSVLEEARKDALGEEYTPAADEVDSDPSEGAGANGSPLVPGKASLEQLLKMEADELKHLVQQLDIEVPSGARKAQLIDLVVSAQED